MNDTPKQVILHTIQVAASLCLFAFGLYLTIQANIGVSPWDSFALGLAAKLGVKYGTAAVTISLCILVLDILLKQKIGIGMILDAVMVGKVVDPYNWLDLVPKRDNTFVGIGVMLIGFVIIGFSQYLYMKAGLSCGPRDSLLVGLNQKMPNVPIGAISVALLAVVTLVGFLLKGPLGIGTVISVLAAGPIMNLIFNLFRFDAKSVEHQNIVDSLAVLTGKKER